MSNPIPASGILPPSIDALVETAQAHPNQIYINNFLNNLGASDISTILMRDTEVVGVLHLSYTTAKTFALMLGQAISRLEEITGQKIMTTHHISEKMNEKHEGDHDSH